MVSTPIGNLSDITIRALKILEAVDVIACEDTRTTGRLMARFGIATPLTPYHDHNAERVRPRLLARMREGESVALVSDAGTPLVSDPGYKLVRAAIAEGLAVTPVPGASAVITALAVSGLPTDRFLFAGFPPSRGAARRTMLMTLAAVPATLVFYESVVRLPESLADMAEVLGNREVAVARELTKRFEEIRRGSLVEVTAHYRQAGPPKGEVVVVVAPPLDVVVSEAEVDRQLVLALDSTASLRDAVDAVAAATGLPRRQVYARALELSADGRTDEA
ncbi:MAG: 16S rRNA (cytidine(1402)-2'-O)-methyltransferase [Alphaproteobacteria bacterium]